MGIFLVMLLVSGIVLSFLAGLLLLMAHKDKRKANRLLGAVFFFIGFDVLCNILFLTKVVADFPVCLKLIIPFYYLIPPFIYLYIRGKLGLPGKRKYLWLHFIPAGIIGIETLLFFFSWDIRQYGAIQFLFIGHQSVFKMDPNPVSLWLHFLVRSIQGGVYLFFQYVLIFKIYKSNIITVSAYRIVKIFRWILVLTFVEMIFYIATSLFFTIVLLDLGESVTTVCLIKGSALLICTSYFVVSVYLYFSPSLLYGWKDPVEIEDSAKAVIDAPIDEVIADLEETDEIIGEEVTFVAESIVSPYDSTTLDEFKERFEREVIGGGLFRQQGLKVQEVSALCDIPPRALSYLLTNVYNKGFNDFINECRIDYVVERLVKDDWKGLTLEGLAFESGFSSRTTFFLAFKKNKFVNPTQYLQMHNSGLLK